ncbi:dipeptidase PepE, partial [bacterium]
MARRLLLISNTTNHGQGPLDHVIGEIDDFLGSVRRLVFIPFALQDRAGYTARIGGRLASIGVEVEALTADEAGRRMLASAGAVFTGGGNTFRLLKTLQDAGLLPVLRERARAGMPYLGSSA